MKFTMFIEHYGFEDWDKLAQVSAEDVDRYIERARQDPTVSMIQVWERITDSVVFQATRPTWTGRRELIEEIDFYHPVHLAEIIPLRRQELADDDLELVEENDKCSGGC
ncbi:MAG: hypothetical protein ABIH67_03640 [Candidatus Uhrbacteria bacterium]